MAVRRARRALFQLAGTWAAICAAGLSFAPAAGAHTDLLATQPADGTVLESVPDDVVLTFDGRVDAVPNGVVAAVAAPDGSTVQVDLGAPQHLGGDNRTVVVTVPADAPRGSWLVGWRVISADSHALSGTFAFTVSAAPTTSGPTAPAPTVASAAPAGPSSAPSTTSRTPSTEDLLARIQDRTAAPRVSAVLGGLGRWLLYGGLAVLVGGLLFGLVIDPSALHGRRAMWACLMSGVALIVGALLVIAAQAGTIGASARSLVEVGRWGDVASTSSGRWWFARAGVAVVLGGAALFARRSPKSPRGHAIATVVGLQAGVGVAWTTAMSGHADSGRASWLGIPATTLHLLAMATWLGCLLWLALTWSHTPDGARRTRLRRLGVIATACLATLVATGLANGWREIGSLGPLTATTYGRVLLVKLVVIAGLIATAALARRRRDTGSLLRPMTVELGLGAAVLAMSAGLVAQTPSYLAAAAPVTRNVVVGGRVADIVLGPGRTNGELHVTVSATGGTLERPRSVTVTADLPAAGIRGLVIPTEDAGPGHVTTNDAGLPSPGRWLIMIVADYPSGPTTFRVAIDVR